ncbi:alpha/beta fold hydrolase [Kribbella sp. CA-294648]|uniref:alpha/beta fold hydrolase n=1 Tax=Kribbella sp. CA-294648 TaxID=3239948 RepID=UPI003D942B11
MRRPDIDSAVRPLVRNMVVPEALRMMRDAYRHRRLTVPTLIIFGRRDHPLTEQRITQICRNPTRYADHIEFAYIDNAAHFITDDAPTEVAHLTLNWLKHPT